MSVNTPSSSPDSTLPLPAGPDSRSDARKVYDILEIRTRILKLLGPSELVRFMVVDKSGMYTVAKVLCHTLTYDEFLSGVPFSSPRRDMYYAAVTEIHIETSKSPYTRSYDSFAEIREACPNLQRIAVGRKYNLANIEGDRLVFHYDPAASAAAEQGSADGSGGSRNAAREAEERDAAEKEKGSSGDTSKEKGSEEEEKPTDGPAGGIDGEGGNEEEEEEAEQGEAHNEEESSEEADEPIPEHGAWHIDMIDKLLLSLSRLPPTNIRGRLEDSDTCTTSHRFDLYLISGSHQLALMSEWAIALRDHEIYGNLYKSVFLGSLPVPLGTICRLYERQTERGHAERLARVVASNVLPWGIGDFQSLAKVAYTSLTLLDLAAGYDRNTLAINYDARRNNVAQASFADLPGLIIIIRKDLPNLQILTMALRGIDDGEITCGGCLREDCLSDTGSLRTLRIHTASHTIHPFNIIRLLAPLVANGADLSVHGTDPPGGTSSDQVSYLSYLRSQSPARQAHLATCDFPSLDITQYAHVHYLFYDDAGRPKRRGVGYADRWHETSLDLANEAMPNAGTGLIELTEASAYLKSISDTAGRTEMVEASRRLLVLLRNYRAAGEETGSDAGRVVRQMEAELLRYMEPI